MQDPAVAGRHRRSDPDDLDTADTLVTAAPWAAPAPRAPVDPLDVPLHDETVELPGLPALVGAGAAGAPPAEPPAAPPAGDDGGQDESSGLGRKASKALGWSFASTILGRLGRMAFSVFIARLLGPEEFGVYAVAMVAQLAILSFNELGVSLAIVRWPGNPREIAPTVATISVVSSTIIYIGCFFGAPYFASAMGAPDATNVVRVLTLSVIISGLVAVPATLLQRDFRQDKRTVADLTTALVSPFTTIVCVLAGMDAMSLALGALAGSVAGAVLFIWFVPEGLRFGFDRDRARKLLRFGMPLAGSSIVVFAAANIDKIVVGAIFGAKPLGIYTNAFNTSNLPVSIFSTPMRAVAPAAFARLQHDKPRMNRAFLMSSSLLGAIALPACIMLATAPHPFIRILYGDKWEPAAPVLSWLALLAALRIFFELVYDYFVVLANTRAVFTIQVVWLIALAPSIWLGAQLFDLPGTGAAQLAVGVFIVLPMYLWELRRNGIGARAVAASMAVPVGVCLLLAGAVLLIQLALTNDWLVLISVGLVGVAAMGAMLYRMRATLKTLRGGTPEPA